VTAGGGQAGAAKFSDVADLHLRHLVRGNEAVGCRASAEHRGAMNQRDAASLYKAACLRAVTASVHLVTDKCAIMQDRAKRLYIPIGRQRLLSRSGRIMQLTPAAPTGATRNLARVGP
jgi:hypothetical protein